MPDMSKPGAHIEDLLTKVRFRAKDCRRKASDLNLRAVVYDDMAIELELVLRAEAEKLGQLGKNGEESK